MAKSKGTLPLITTFPPEEYKDVFSGISELLEFARRHAARAVNSIMAATYWEIGKRIVEFEQKGKARADYGKTLLIRLSSDLTKRYGRGFSRSNLQQMRLFYFGWEICQTPSGKSGMMVKGSCPNSLSTGRDYTSLTVQARTSELFLLPWSHYVRLMAIENLEARAFYEQEALRGGWSVRQLDRQISSLFYERSLLSRNKANMLKKGTIAKLEDAMTPEEEVKDPYVLEFLNLKDEYTESDLEDALIHHLEQFLLELGGDFAFVGRQRRLRIGDEWYRIDLLFFHRRLKCLVIIDLKMGKLTHADAGQMHMYLNYAKEHWTMTNENPPVGLILCADKNRALAHYALEGLSNKVLASEYKLVLPDEKTLAEELERTRKELNSRIGEMDQADKKTGK